MSAKVLFKVHGYGELNGNYKINIVKELDKELAYKLRSKNNLIQFVKQECPGIQIKENSLGYNIVPIKDTPSTVKNTSNKISSTKKQSTSKNTSLGLLKNLSTKKIIGGVIGAAIVAPIIKEVVLNIFENVKDSISDKKNNK